MDSGYLAQQVTTIIGQLHGLFDEIGVPGHERDSREAELFSALSETLHNQLRLVTTEKHEMAEECNRLISNIKQMERSLDGRQQSGYDIDDQELKVTYPLTRCLQNLKEKHNNISKLHRERFEQVKKLAEAIESFASHLEPSFVMVKLPPTSPNATISPSFDVSPAYVTSLDNEFTRIYEEYNRRVSEVKGTCHEIINMWAELGTPQAQTDSSIVQYARDQPEQLGLHQDDLIQLRAKRDRLVEEKRGRERRVKELKIKIEDLWNRLGVEEHERKGFLSSNRGCSLRTINEFESELSRLNELKRQNLHLFVEDARCKLQELWDSLYFSEEEMLEFTPAFSDVYSDALLSAHESEIARLEALKEQRAPTLELIDRHRSLVKERDDLSASSQDASRLMLRGQKGEKRDPGKLLREEKMRKRIAKELPKVEADLKKTLERWENEYGRPFLVHGERYLDELLAASSRAPPPRAKTPSGHPPPAPKSVPKSAPMSQRGGTVRGPPPTRAKTPTANSSMLNMSTTRNPLASSVSTSTLKSPSKIPSRVPLSNMPHGNNSPERRVNASSSVNNSNMYETMRKMGPPRAPPPKMKDLFAPPEPVRHNSYERDVERSASIVRHIDPEDVYDDRVQRSGSYVQRSQYPPQYQPQVPSTRQISATSSITNTVSGSENWETYDDASDPEPDATDAYYDKLRQARGKRFTPDGGYPSPRGGQVKKFKGIMAVGVEQQTLMETENGLVRVEESDAGWTDEDAF
ncbi:hypothetical protein M501DRAFT_1017098 [Patellaria atrata CBS 101060]|uniref:Microtubule associated protein n=1 Tax=Patellaria atrata CBS 101060 TaxID=1346257 RepID=A0A9P4VQ85_9PEZI|nr:hypothetical protein M501DRAFT_1017098 [Patellaria atrata CBS 101060]